MLVLPTSQGNYAIIGLKVSGASRDLEAVDNVLGRFREGLAIGHEMVTRRRQTGEYSGVLGAGASPVFQSIALQTRTREYRQELAPPIFGTEGQGIELNRVDPDGPT